MPASPVRPRRVLVTGAAGFLGRAVLRALRDHDIAAVGLHRKPKQAEWLAAAGATPFLGDVRDPATVLAAARGCDAFLHLASAANDPAASETEAAHVRVDGVRHLLKAATAAGGGRVVLGSGYWVYRGIPGTIDERSPLEPAGESKTNLDAERAVLAGVRTGTLEAIVVRPAMVYGDGAWFRATREAIADGSYRTIDDGRNFWSFVSLPDTAEAFVTILERGVAGEVYNVADGAPAPWGEFVADVARRLGRPAPPTITAVEANERFGPVVARHLAANRAVSGTKLRALGWQPRYPRYPEGLAPLFRGSGRA